MEMLRFASKSIVSLDREADGIENSPALQHWEKAGKILAVREADG